MSEVKEVPDSEGIRAEVRRYYAERAGESECGCAGSSCCSSAESREAAIGYSRAELAEGFAEANLGLGCGNPIALATLSPGERVLDLGSGAGFDCFLAASRVGAEGNVVGVDMTAEMVAKARAIAARRGVRNVEFRLGEIEHLPVADASFDVIISNCVINLSPDKEQVFRDAHRALRAGGRLAIADIMEIEPMPEELRNDPALHCGCVSGAVDEGRLRALLERAGFIEVSVTRLRATDGPAGPGPEGHVAAVLIAARRV